MVSATVNEVEEIQHEASLWDHFRSRPRVLAKWFLESRDRWKQKCMEIRKEVKRLKVRVADVDRSRQQWRQKAEQRGRELDELKSQLQQLQQGIQSDELKKTNHPIRPN